VVDSNGGWLERSKTDSFPPPNEKEENKTQMDGARIYILRLYVCRKELVVVGWLVHVRRRGDSK
jgi:hypothetical protein